MIDTKPVRLTNWALWTNSKHRKTANLEFPETIKKDKISQLSAADLGKNDDENQQKITTKNIYFSNDEI